MSIQLKDFDAWVRSILPLAELAKIDSSQNGIQVDRRKQELSKVAFGVDACMETFRRTKELGADLLFVHHGLFWGREQVLTGTHYQRLSYLIQNDIGLYAAHLPLDAHLEVGNNAVMAREIGLVDVSPFGIYKGTPIGVRGSLPLADTVDGVLTRLFGDSGSMIAVLPFGKPVVQTVGLISGGGVYEVDQAIEADLDLYITGDANHVVYHRCMEAGINVVFAGHYLTETWGPRAMMERFISDTGLAGVFIDVPTGL